MFSFTKKRRSAKKRDPRPNRSLDLSFESLEKREMMAGDISFHDVGGEGVVTITGTNSRDTALVEMDGARRIKVLMNSVSNTKTFDASRVDKIVFKGYGGNDYFTNDTSINTEAYGHWGDDTIVGGSGNDYLSGGSGKDLVIGWRRERPSTRQFRG